MKYYNHGSGGNRITQITFAKVVFIMVLALCFSVLFLFRMENQSCLDRSESLGHNSKSIIVNAESALNNVKNENSNMKTLEVKEQQVSPTQQQQIQQTQPQSEYISPREEYMKQVSVFINYLYYYQLYSNITIESPSYFKYNTTQSIVLPSRGFSNPAVRSIEYHQHEIDKLLLELPSIEVRDKLNFAERRRLESEITNEFYEYEQSLDNVDKIQKHLGLTINPRPMLETPLKVIYPKPLISAPYVWLHIPKTGGNSIIYLFKRTFGAAKAHQQWVHPGYSEKDLVREKKAVVGHFNYGLHSYLTGQEKETFSYMTMMRDPIDRVISHYYYHREQVNDEGHKLAMSLDFKDWVQQSARGQNEQARVLAGISTEAEFLPNDETFRMALYHLRKMKFVGITERFTESIILMKYYCGLTDLTEVKSNKRKRPPALDSIPQDVIDIIREKNWMDIYLYEEALRMFERQIDIVGRDLLEREYENIRSPYKNKN